MQTPDDTELTLLETLDRAQKSKESITQRELSQRSGLSLGMTNMLVRRFVTRGWVKLVKAAGRTWFYALTPAGFEEVANRSYGFLRRTASTVKTYYDRVETFVLDAKQRGVEQIVYEAPLEIEFMFRYSCQRHGLSFCSGLPSRRESERKLRMLRVRSCVDTPSDQDCEEVELASIIAGHPD